MTNTATHRGLTTFALILVVFMTAAEATIVATALPTIIADVGGVQHYGWVTASYLLATTVTVPIYGRLSDVFGRRPILWLGIVLFLGGSMLCGFAGSMTILLAGRTLQGLGAGSIQPVAMTIIGDLYTIAERGRIQGWIGAVWGVAGIAGPMLGAWIVTAMAWGWVFWINLPFGAAAVALLAYAYREKGQGGDAAIDWPGAITFAGAALSLLLAMGGTAPKVLTPLGLLLSALFIVVERRAKSPILPLSLLARRDVAVASVVSLGLGAILMAVVNFLPLFIQGVKGGTPVQAGSLIAPMLIGWPIAATLSSKAILRFGARRAVLLGCVMCAIACACLMAAALHGGRLEMGASMFLLGTGLGAATSTLVIVLQSSVGWRERGVITATNVFARFFGGTLGVTVLGAILAFTLEKRLDPSRVAQVLDRDRVGTVVDPEVVSALTAAFQPMFTVVVVFAIGVAVASYWYREKPVPATQAL
ncbi:MAG TPA: MFS transporter [Gemmatimonadales bacterium]|nr:MFS transporter [Gemmatimonadales bacterium]